MSRMPVRTRKNAEITVRVGNVEGAHALIGALCPRATGKTIFWRSKITKKLGKRVKVRLFIDEYTVRNNTEYDLMRFVTEASERAGVQLFAAELTKPGTLS